MKCCCLLTVLAMSLLVVGISVGVPLAMRKVREAVKEIGDTAVREACEVVTSYPETCKETFSSSSSSSSASSNNNDDDDDDNDGTTKNYDRTAVGVTIFSLQTASAGVNDTLAAILALNESKSSEKGHVSGVIALAAVTAVCVESLTSSMELLEAAVKELNVTEKMKSPLSTHDIDWKDPEGVKGREQVQLGDVKVWATAAMEMHATCIDAVVEIGTPSIVATPGNNHRLQDRSSHTHQLLSNALAFLNAFAAYGPNFFKWKSTEFSVPNDLTNLSAELPPSWMSHHQGLIPSSKLIPGLSNRRRRLLLISTDNSSGAGANPVPQWMYVDTVVAADGSGQYTTIQEAINSYITRNINGAIVSTGAYAIYIKAGVYEEQVTVPKHAKNVVFVGDGVQTVITGSRSIGLMQPGMTTFKSATLIIEGSGFVGRSFKVQNTAGPSGHQAVAVRVSADQVIFYRCIFEGWQSTLHAHTFRHFYRECTISGTVDFIFGNAAAAFQLCNITAKNVMQPTKPNTYSAQGRSDSHQNTGFSFQNCTFEGCQPNNISSHCKTYLGRPMKPYSVCVLLMSNLGSHIDPTGWLPWNNNDTVPNFNGSSSNSFFLEYGNLGPGANTTYRVPWSHQTREAGVAEKYQASNFIQADSWQHPFDIPFKI